MLTFDIFCFPPLYRFYLLRLSPLDILSKEEKSACFSSESLIALLNPWIYFRIDSLNGLSSILLNRLKINLPFSDNSFRKPGKRHKGKDNLLEMSIKKLKMSQTFLQNERKLFFLWVQTEKKSLFYLKKK